MAARLESSLALFSHMVYFDPGISPLSIYPKGSNKCRGMVVASLAVVASRCSQLWAVSLVTRGDYR